MVALITRKYRSNYKVSFYLFSRRYDVIDRLLNPWQGTCTISVITLLSIIRFIRCLHTKNLLSTSIRKFTRHLESLANAWFSSILLYALIDLGIDLFIIEETNIILSRNRMNHDRDRISMNKSHANNERPVSSQTRHFIRGDRIGIGVFLAKDSELTLEGSTD